MTWRNLERSMNRDRRCDSTWSIQSSIKFKPSIVT